MTLLLGILMGATATLAATAFAGDLRNAFCDHHWHPALPLPHSPLLRCRRCGKYTQRKDTARSWTLNFPGSPA